MRTPLAVVLDVDAVHIVTRDDDAAGTMLPWTPGDSDSPDIAATMQRVASTVRTGGHAPSGVVLVVGLGFLEIAQPELPPLTPAAQRTLLLRDADRYFPIAEPVAVVMDGQLAFAAPAAWLQQCTSALSELAPVRAILAAPMLVRGTAANETVGIPAAVAESGLVVVRGAAVQEVRRVSSGRATAGPAAAAPDRQMDATQLGQAALAQHDAPLAQQLLDATLLARVHGTRVRRVAATLALATFAVLLLLGAADRWRATVLQTARLRADSLVLVTQPAQRASARVQRATTEMQALVNARVAQQGADAPLNVLAHLSRVLPSDAFVQKLEWTGTVWRVEGTADNAPRLIPLLDGDGHFQDVRVAGTGQRFVDAGRQRESFAITFLMTPVSASGDPAGGLDGQP